MKEFKRILVVSRMIQSSRKAIQYGVSLARKYDAQLFVIHCISLLSYKFVSKTG